MPLVNALSTIQKQRRDEIILAAISSLAENGYVATSFAEIGRRVGLSKSVVAYHFTSKEALIDAVVNAIYDKGFTVVRPAMDEAATAQGKIDAFIKRSIYFYQEYREYVVALGSLRVHLSSKGTPNTTAVSRLHKELTDIGIILHEGQIRGEFRDFSVPIMARTLRQALDGVLIEMTHHPGLDTDEYTKELTQLFEKTLRKEENDER